MTGTQIGLGFEPEGEKYETHRTRKGERIHPGDHISYRRGKTSRFRGTVEMGDQPSAWAFRNGEPLKQLWVKDHRTGNVDTLSGAVEIKLLKKGPSNAAR